MGAAKRPFSHFGEGTLVKHLWENLLRKEEEENDVSRALSQCYVFQTLSTREIKFVRDMVHIRQYRPGENIFRQGEVGVGMYVILKGRVDIVVENEDTRDINQARLITQLEPGDFFGEIALVEDKGRRTASGFAHTEVTLVGFFKPDLEEIVARNPATGAKIMTQLAYILGLRLKETAKKVSELKQQIKTLG
jgi:CRP-like cAMP-binding protein